MPAIYKAPNRAGLPYTPYLTVDEYLNDPDAVDASILVPNGTVQQNRDALAQKIIQASGWMNRQVHYVLAATLDTETRKAMVRVDGKVRLPCRGFPITEITSFSVGLYPSGMVAISANSYGDIWSEDNIIEVPVDYAQTSGTIAVFGPGDKVYCQWQYVNGWANTLLNGNAAQGATSIVVNSSLGIYAGMQLTIYDLAKTETITVDSSYADGQGSSTTIPLLSGTSLLFQHNSGVSVSALPGDVKKAAILATSGHIKTRGSGALEMASMDTDPSKEVRGEAEALEDLATAAAFLTPFKLSYYG